MPLICFILKVNELVDCFISANNWQSCALLKAVMTDSREHFDIGKNTYLGGGSGTPSLLRALSHALIVQTMGHWRNITNVSSRNQCDDLNKHQTLYVYVWQRDPVQNKSRCYRTSTFVTMARSPAFEIEDFDLSNGRYSSWVESVWQNASIRLFLIAPPSYQWILAALACLMLIVSIASVLFIGKYGQMLVQWPMATVDEGAIAAPL